MNKVISIFLGLVLLAIGIFAWGVNFAGLGDAALSFLKGGILWIVLFIGLVLVILGISDLMN